MAKRLLSVLAFSALAGLMSQATAASEYKAIYSFCAQAGCTDGELPFSGVILDPSGTLYGATLGGGAVNEGAGAVFALVPDGDGWQYQVLYSFCSQPLCADGESPAGGLIEDLQGNLYGTTQIAGGPGDGGTVFKLTHDAARTAWTYSKLHTFCIKRKKCPDGLNPNSALTYQGAASGAPYDGVSPLYGTTGVGAAPGNVYQLTPGSGGTWTLTVVYDFCTQEGCPAGYGPSFGLIMDGSGDLFVNTLRGSSGGSAGGIAELTQNQGTWTAKQIYGFCSTIACSDGGAPFGKLTLDAAGDLFGTTKADGKYSGGVLFELSPTKHKWKERVLYNFCHRKNCADGAAPLGGVTMDGAGNLIGTTSDYGAMRDGGTVFRYAEGKLQLLYTFCQQQDSCADGNAPTSAPIVDGAGNIFGTTYFGGAANEGTIYEITP
jgi:uncharacterized repeat protein (TIGR03803 family)